MKSFFEEMPRYMWPTAVMCVMFLLLCWMYTLQSVAPAWVSTTLFAIGGLFGIIGCITIWGHCPEWYHKGSAIGAIFVVAYTMCICAIARMMGVSVRDLPSITTLPTSIGGLSFIISTFVMSIKRG